MAKAVRMLDSYKPEDVDKYIGSLIAEFDKKCKELNDKVYSLTKDYQSMTAEVKAMKKEVEEYDSRKALIADSILNAKVFSEKIITEANEEKERILAEAREMAEQTVASTTEEVEKLVKETQANIARDKEEAENELNTIKNEIDNALKNREEVLSKMEEELMTRYNEIRENHRKACMELDVELGNKKTEYNSFLDTVREKINQLTKYLFEEGDKGHEES